MWARIPSPSKHLLRFLIPYTWDPIPLIGGSDPDILEHWQLTISVFFSFFHTFHFVLVLFLGLNSVKERREFTPYCTRPNSWLGMNSASVLSGDKYELKRILSLVVFNHVAYDPPSLSSPPPPSPFSTCTQIFRAPSLRLGYCVNYQRLADWI